MPKPILNVDTVEYERELKHGSRFDAKVAPISSRLGAKKLAYNVTVVAPGKRAFPFHNHHVNEELFLILDGEGVLRFGAEEYPVGRGDVIACPPGGPEVAHQLVNSGEDELRYFSLSTAMATDIFQYPDSGKFGAVAGRLPGTRPQEAPFVGFYAESERLEYWDGE